MAARSNNIPKLEYRLYSSLIYYSLGILHPHDLNIIEHHILLHLLLGMHSSLLLNDLRERSLDHPGLWMPNPPLQ